MEIADSNGVSGKGIEIALTQVNPVVSYKSLDTQTSSKKETNTTTCTKKYCQYFSLLKVVLLRDPDVNPVLQLRDPLREARGLLDSTEELRSLDSLDPGVWLGLFFSILH